MEFYMNIRRGLGAIALLALAAQANADVLIFADDFNGENGGVGALNYNGFANWTVNPQSVDLIGNGFFDLFPGNGLYVDLDGTTGSPGTMTTNNLGLIAGRTYVLEFQLGGAHRNNGNNDASVEVTVGQLVQAFTLADNDPLTTFSYTFVANGDGALAFAGGGAGDNQGLILDNVQLVMVPLPGGVLMGAVGLGMSGLFVRSRAAKRRRQLA
jgi:hypothetical protein